MSKAKNLIKYLPFALVFVLMLIMHSFLNQSFDDLAYATELDRFNIPQYIVHNYTGFSSRILVNCFLMYITRWPIWIWKLLDSAAMTAVGVYAYRLLKPMVGTVENEIGLIWASALTSLIYPFCDMKSAGHITTTVTYLWPFLFMLVCLDLWQKQLRSGGLKAGDIVLWFIACFVAGDSEQCTAVMLGAAVLIMIYRIVTKQKISKLFIIQSIFVFGIMIFILTCPGNQVRNTFEIAERFPEFAGLGIKKKLDIGFSETMYHFIFKANVIFALFAASLMCASTSMVKKNYQKIICSIPFVISMVFSVLGEVTYQIFPMAKYLTLTLSQTGTLEKGSYTGMLAYAIYILLIATALYAFYVMYMDSKDTLALIFGAGTCLGFASHYMLGFSPTIFASGDRAYLLLNIALLMISVGLWGRIESRSGKNVMLVAMIAIGALSYISNLVDIFVDFLL